jgi:hypothetical protein
VDEIPIGVVGKIVSLGDRVGWSVKVEHDAADTGGYFILEWMEGTRTGFDSWVKEREDVDRFFAESGWVVEWSSCGHEGAGD